MQVFTHYAELCLLIGVVLLLALAAPTEAAVYAIVLADVPVFASSGSFDAKRLALLPLGAIVVGSPDPADPKWLRLRLPRAGAMPLTAQQGGATSKLLTPGDGGKGHICQLVQGGKRGDRAFLAGNNTLCSCTASAQSSWIDQWPVGSAGLGALVGGNIGAEVVPVSRADFYVAQRRLINARFEDAKNAGEVHAAMKAMRDAHMAGQGAAAHKSSDRVRARGGQGRFEFLGDLALTFGGTGIVPSCGGAGARLGGLTEGPRGIVLQGLQSELSKVKGSAEQCFLSAPLGLQAAHLHMAQGAASASYVSIDGKAVHHRRWLVSPGGVLHGVLQCEATEAAEHGGCLNLALQLSRTSAKREGGNLQSGVESLGKHKPLYAAAHAEQTHDVMYKMSLNLGPTVNFLAPHAVMCVAVVCEAPPGYHGKEDPSDTTREFRHHSSADMVLCRGGRRAHVFAASEAQDSLEALQNAMAQWSSKKSGGSYDAGTLAKLKERCGRRLDVAMQASAAADAASAAGAGAAGLAGQAAAHFAPYMQSQTLQIGPSLAAASELDKAAPGSVGAASAMWQYGRYLLLAGGNGHAANLQGVWGEGRASEWNGDYHLNINLQMMYWPAEAAGLGAAVMPPLVEFLKHLRTSGVENAKRMYNCKGWVAHGFVDAYLDTGIMSDVRWAYCISCGAWASLALWEHLSFTPAAAPSYAAAMQELLLSFQGTAEFFLDHFAVVKKSDGTLEYHTGPTGSPETSYLAAFKGAGGKGENQQLELAMSPALDVSVLRNIALAYSAAAQLDQKAGATHRRLGSGDSVHLAMSKKLLEAVQRLPNSGLPKTTKSGHIAEFPNPFGHPSDKSDSFTVDESSDFGHRHWSGMHWLFPASFVPPVSAGGELFKAAEATLSAKTAAGSGHTSWSASWQASLWARLGRGNDAWAALEHILDRYTTPRLMSLHPKLKPSGSGCSTCYAERTRGISADKNGKYPRGHAVANANKRSATTQDEAIFQADGNSGFAAGVFELLLQTHTPGLVQLLPAVPSAWLEKGTSRATGLRGRGDLTADVAWTAAADRKSAKLLGARLLFGSQHFYHSLGAGGEQGVRVLGPGGQGLRTVASECAQQGMGAQVGRVIVSSYPCTVYVCDDGSDADCKAALAV